MKYVSTRGDVPESEFDDILLAGLAGDGGLFLPSTWPRFSSETIAGFAGLAFHEVAFTLTRPFVGGAINDAALKEICRAAYGTFGHPAVAPLRQMEPGQWVLELFHGPTLAFKDVAMQLVARLMDHVLSARGERVTIVGATSGDTGAAAIEAFRQRDNADVFILFPRGRVSPIQQRQMTTTGAANVHAIAIEGTFDDCQAIVKELFSRVDFREQVNLAGVNSINWARILGQVTYYFTAAVALGSPHRAVSFTVPTGNFGDIYAGLVAKRLGLPIDRLCIASNVNDILTRALATGRYEVQGVVPTTSPSMDIQVSSNFERLLYSASGENAVAVRRSMAGLSQSGAFEIDVATLDAIRADFDAERTSEQEVLATIGATYRATGFLADPHTAVGLTAAARLAQAPTPMITLATAHAAKFPDAVEAATGIAPGLPERMRDIVNAEEHFDVLANDGGAVAELILARSRAVSEGAR